MLTHHSASSAVAAVAEANFKTRGVRVVPYPSDMRAIAPNAQLAAMEHHWGGFYTHVATSVLDGTWTNAPVWGGIASGMVDIAAVDAKLPAAMRAGLLARRQAIVGGSLQPFGAPLIDNAGVVRLARGSLDDARIKTMDWLAEGVVGAMSRRS